MQGIPKNQDGKDRKSSLKKGQRRLIDNFRPEKTAWLRTWGELFSFRYKQRQDEINREIGLYCVAKC